MSSNCIELQPMMDLIENCKENDTINEGKYLELMNTMKKLYEKVNNNQPTITTTTSTYFGVSVSYIRSQMPGMFNLDNDNFVHSLFRHLSDKITEEYDNDTFFRQMLQINTLFHNNADEATCLSNPSFVEQINLDSYWCGFMYQFRGDKQLYYFTYEFREWLLSKKCIRKIVLKYFTENRIKFMKVYNCVSVYDMAKFCYLMSDYSYKYSCLNESIHKTPHFYIRARENLKTDKKGEIVVCKSTEKEKLHPIEVSIQLGNKSVKFDAFTTKIRFGQSTALPCYMFMFMLLLQEGIVNEKLFHHMKYLNYSDFELLTSGLTHQTRTKNRHYQSVMFSNGVTHFASVNVKYLQSLDEKTK